MGSRLRLHPGVYFLAVLWILILPPAWGMGAILAMAVHELCHLLVIILCGGQICGFRMMPWGAEILTTPMGKGREVLCALAGPVGSFSMLFMAEYFPEAALCGLVQGAYNLLPIYPLDGGRALNLLLGVPISRAMDAFFMTLLTGICLWLLPIYRDFSLFLLLSVWMTVFRRKSSCKEPKLAVQ